MNYRFGLTILISLLFVTASPAAAISPYKAEIKGKKRVFSRAQQSKKLKFTIRTAEGRFKAVLKPRVAFNPGYTTVNGRAVSLPKDSVRLFKGYVTRKNKKVPAAADLTGDSFRVRFKGLRTKRSYSAKIKASSKTSKAKLSRARIKSSYTCEAHAPMSSPQVARAFAGEYIEFQTSPAVTQFLEISTDADQEYYEANNSDTTDTFAEIQSILNAVEAFYLNQIGIGFTLRGQNVFTDEATQPYQSRNASDLITEFGCEVRGEQHIPAADVFHLFTGKNLSGSTIGIAWVGAVCTFQEHQRTGVSQLVSDANEAILTAHEIGHNLDADHDEVTDSIMSPVINSANTTFSAFSVGQITSHINNFGSCLENDASYGAKVACPTPTPTPVPTATPVPPTPTPIPTPIKPEATPIPVDPEISLSLNITAKKFYTFTSSVITKATIPSECSVKLYASGKKRLLNSTIFPLATLIKEFGASDVVITNEASFKRKRRNNRRKNVFFKAVMTCNGVTTQSEVVKQRVKIKNQSKPVKRFLNQLKKFI